MFSVARGAGRQKKKKKDWEGIEFATARLMLIQSLSAREPSLLTLRGRDLGRCLDKTYY